jgi:transposase
MRRESKSRKSTKTTRKRHTEEFKREALALAEQVGVAEAGRQLGLHQSQLYDWRSKAHAVANQSAVDQRLAAENAKLKRQVASQAEELAILKKAAAYFARELK